MVDTFNTYDVMVADTFNTLCWCQVVLALYTLRKKKFT